MNSKLQYKSLVESLRLLASPYEGQIECLPDFVNVQDEVTGAFGDAFLLLPQLIEGDFLSMKGIASIVRCFNWVDMTSQNEELSSIDSFKNHEAWQKVRVLAEQALNNMGEKKEKPDLSHLKWID